MRNLSTGPDNAWFGELLRDSYRRVVGVPMVPEGSLTGADAARWLYRDAPFCLLAHDGSADPAFIYANVSAQKCFEYSWEEFVGCLPGCRPKKVPGGSAKKLWRQS
jgi:hypothetical protein